MTVDESLIDGGDENFDNPFVDYLQKNFLPDEDVYKPKKKKDKPKGLELFYNEDTLITDTHFGARNDSLAFNDHFYKFWEKTFFPYLDDNGIDTIIHLGDVFDRRKFISYKIAKDFRERFIKPIVHRNIKMHMIVGNHDTYYRNTNEINSLYELLGGPGDERYPNIQCYDHPCTEEFDGVGIHLLPWINESNYESVMRGIQMTYADICMGHLEVNGFEMHAGHFCEQDIQKKCSESLTQYSLVTFTRSQMMDISIILVIPTR